MAFDGSSLLRHLPSVDRFLEDPALLELMESYPREIVVEGIRHALESVRSRVIDDKGTAPDVEEIGSIGYYIGMVREKAESIMRPSLRRVINATGIVIHTNLGRSPIAPEMFDRARDIATRYSNLEYDLDAGKRGSRHDHIESLLTRLTGAEAAVVTNNCAAALLTSLQACARGREVIVSRGELIEIGGSFRLPELMEASGARLVEVGTTNRTHPKDYEKAITPQTAAILKVHLSNFRQEGFTTDVPAADLAGIASEAGIPLLHDVGSGALVQIDEGGDPTVPEEVASGADLVMMSGDKLLGSVQAGIVVGRREMVEKVRSCPVMRAVRPDKVTLALLEATLLSYLDEPNRLAQIPVLRLILRPLRDIKEDAEKLRQAFLEQADPQPESKFLEGRSEAGGGAIGQRAVETVLFSISPGNVSADQIARKLRANDPPVVVRVQQDNVVIDPRTLFPEEIPLVAKALALAMKGESCDE